MPHDDHAHHPHQATADAASRRPLRASWLRHSALWRLTGAGGAIVVLWLGVVWALR